MTVTEMFDQIAATYDRINTLLSGGIDRYWRKKMASFLPTVNPQIKLLDCATGTGDQILSLLKTGKIHQAVGIDLSEKMLEVGREKMAPFRHMAELQHASATALPYLDNTFDCVTMSFGIRNVDNVEECLKELYRVVSPRGRVLILEFSIPKSQVWRKAYLLYLRKLLPRVGKLVSKHPGAYTYLSQTIEAFPHGDAFCKLLEGAGFQAVKAHPLTGGVATIYQGDKWP